MVTIVAEHILDARVPSLGRSAGENSLQQFGLSFRELNILNEHGLIIGEYNSWYDMKDVRRHFHAWPRSTKRRSAHPFSGLKIGIGFWCHQTKGR